MNRREFLKISVGLGFTLALPALAIDSKSGTEIDNFDTGYHPKIIALRKKVVNLVASEDQKIELLRVLDLNRDRFIDGTACRWHGHKSDGTECHETWGDIESLIHHSPGMGLDIWFYRSGGRGAFPGL